MNKIFLYELKLVLWNKFFAVFSLIICGYSYFVLTTHTILGKNGTAPFSVESFVDYLQLLTPLTFLMIVIYVFSLYSKKEQGVYCLFSATPTNMKKLKLIKICSIAIGYFILTTLILSFCFIFYRRFFHYTDFTHFLLPAFLITIVILLLGIVVGISAGQILKKLSSNTFKIKRRTS